MHVAYLAEDLGGGTLDDDDSVAQLVAKHVLVLYAPLVHIAHEGLERVVSQLLVRSERHKNGFLHLARVAVLISHFQARATWDRPRHDHVQRLDSEVSLLKIFESFLDLSIADLVAAVTQHFQNGASAAIKNALFSQLALHVDFDLVFI